MGDSNTYLLSADISNGISGFAIREMGGEGKVYFSTFHSYYDFEADLLEDGAAVSKSQGSVVYSVTGGSYKKPTCIGAGESFKDNDGAVNPAHHPGLKTKCLAAGMVAAIALGIRKGYIKEDSVDIKAITSAEMLSSDILKAHSNLAGSYQITVDGRTVAVNLQIIKTIYEGKGAAWATLGKFRKDGNNSSALAILGDIGQGTFILSSSRRGKALEKSTRMVRPLGISRLRAQLSTEISETLRDKGVYTIENSAIDRAIIGAFSGKGFEYQTPNQTVKLQGAFNRVGQAYFQEIVDEIARYLGTAHGASVPSVIYIFGGGAHGMNLFQNKLDLSHLRGCTLTGIRDAERVNTLGALTLLQEYLAATEATN